MADRLRAPKWFWIVAILLLLWGVAGVMAWVQQLRLGAEAMGPASAYDRALYAALPGWYNWVYATATGAGLAGAGALLARSRLAIPLFVISLVAVVVMFGWFFSATDVVAVKGMAEATGFPIAIALIAVFQIWLARHAAQRGWIG